MRYHMDNVVQGDVCWVIGAVNVCGLLVWCIFPVIVRSMPATCCRHEFVMPWSVDIIDTRVAFVDLFMDLILVVYVLHLKLHVHL